MKEAVVMSGRHGKRYSPRFNFREVMEIFTKTISIGQIARSYCVHLVTLPHWTVDFIEKGPELFSHQTTIQEYDKRIKELELNIEHALWDKIYVSYSENGAKDNVHIEPFKGGLKSENCLPFRKEDDLFNSS